LKRILITGSNGLLGQRLSMMLSGQTEYEVLNTSIERSFVFDDHLYDYTQLDITQRSDVKSLISSFQPDVILNAAAATNVDWCESNREDAWKINVTAVENLAEGARKVGAKLIHVSTDYVFDGKNGPYDEQAKLNPLSYYGKTKLASENSVQSAGINYSIVRTVVLYGLGIGVKANFVLWVVKSLREGKRIRIVDDQYANPTYVCDLASAMIKLAETNHNGIFHICGSDWINRHEFTVKIAEIYGLDTSLIDRIKTADLKQPAPRPLQSGFITLKAQTQLGMKFLSATEGLKVMKQELESSINN
jgi:dTDP-4-dehydrorhamnose reductase